LNNSITNYGSSKPCVEVAGIGQVKTFATQQSPISKKQLAGGPTWSVLAVTLLFFNVFGLNIGGEKFIKPLDI
jgi:hypothetical protein